LWNQTWNGAFGSELCRKKRCIVEVGTRQRQPLQDLNMNRNEQDTNLEAQIDDNLRKVYQKTLEEQVPDRLTSLLQKLREQDTKHGG